MTRALRAGVIGARRVRQGTGPFAARFLHDAGVVVAGVAGTSLATATEAAEALAGHGIRAKPFESANDLLESGSLDLVVVATPPETHAQIVRAALDARVHVLCEKPFLPGGADDAKEANRLARAFADAGRLLVVAAPWKHALPAYMRLFPAVSPRDATRFEMESAPAEAGPAMLPAAMPHAFAVLDHLYGAYEEPLRGVEISYATPSEARVRFRHPGGRRGVECEVRLRASDLSPRPFAFGFDGAIARRDVEPSSYRMRLVEEASAREVPLPDPYEALVKDVVARARRGPPFPIDPTVASGVARLEQLLASLAGSARGG